MIVKNLDINERMKHYQISGLSIALINNRQISSSEGFGVLEAGTNRKVTQDSLFHACSMSKFLTAMLVMNLSEQGVVDLDENVNIKLKSWKVQDNEYLKDKKVTLRTLLSHQSGLIDQQGSFSEMNPTYGIPTMVDILAGRTPYCNSSAGVKYEPESDFHYSDAGYCLIQLLIEDVTGKSFAEVMNEHIFEPLQMKNSTLEQTLPEKLEYSCGHHQDGTIIDGQYPTYPYPAACGLWTTPSDLAILLIEYMNSLEGNSKVGISMEKAQEMITPQGCKEWSGLGVFLDECNEKTEISSLGWGVGFQSMLIAYPYLGSGAVIMTNTDLGVHQMKGIIGEIYKSLV